MTHFILHTQGFLLRSRLRRYFWTELEPQGTVTIHSSPTRNMHVATNWLISHVFHGHDICKVPGHISLKHEWNCTPPHMNHSKTSHVLQILNLLLHLTLSLSFSLPLSLSLSLPLNIYIYIDIHIYTMIYICYIPLSLSLSLYISSLSQPDTAYHARKCIPIMFL